MGSASVVGRPENYLNHAPAGLVVDPSTGADHGLRGNPRSSGVREVGGRILAHTMASRPLHDPSRVAAPALEKMTTSHADTLREVEDAIKSHDVVVVGMSQNPHVKNVRKMLEAAGVKFHYLEYGSYFSEWGKRLAIKMWSGWPTFPQVYVQGELVGGEDLTKAAIARGDIKAP